MPHPFITLGVPESASQEEIRAAYLDQIRKYPPESNPEEFQEINQAYSAVKADVARAEMRLFGQLYVEEPLASIHPRNSTTGRSRAGVGNWISFLKDGHHGK